MKYFAIILLPVFCLVGTTHLKAQAIERLNVFSYNVNEGLLQSHVDDMAFDKNNFGWLSFANGIQKFDGNKFTDVPLQPGLPDDKSTNFFSTGKGDLLISHSVGISKYEVSNNKFTLIYQNSPSCQQPVLFLGEDNNTIYFFTSDASIIGINAGSFAIESVAATGFKNFNNDPYNKLRSTANIINHCVGLYADSSLILWDLPGKKKLYQVKSPLLFSSFSIFLSNQYEVLYFSNKDDNLLMKYNFKTKSNTTIAAFPDDQNKSPRIIFFSWKRKWYLSYFSNIYEMDAAFSRPLKELKNFQNQLLTGGYVTNAVRQDKLGNLYLLTTNNGIRKIISNNYPVTYYGTEKKENNFIVSVCADKNSNRILAGTQGNGLLIFDTLQHLVKNIRSLPGKEDVFTPTGIVKLNGDGYLLFCWGQKILWKLDKDLSKLTALPSAQYRGAQFPAINYFTDFIFQNDSLGFVYSEGAIFKIDLNKQIITCKILPVRDILGCLYYKNNFVVHAHNELIFLDDTTMAVTKKVPLRNTGGVRCFAHDKYGNIYVGSNKGIFKLDGNGKLLLQVNKATGLPDECIYAMTIDDTGSLWCSTNRGIFKIKNNDVLLQLTKEDGLQENEFNTNVVANADDGEVFFGGVNGVSSFFPSAIALPDEKIKLLITSIKINNANIFDGSDVSAINDLNLRYNQNSLAFDFITMANSNPNQYIYQYKMKGIDADWIQNNNLQTVRYFLPPGEYAFQVAASRFFDKNARPMKEIHIMIHSPFWKTWWFFSVIATGLLFILGYSINYYNEKDYKKKLQIFEVENKLRIERERISRDLHDNIGAYANAVLYKTELLTRDENNDNRNNIINDLHFASKDIITSLRETIWALKKDNYKAEDCMVRIRNFIQPLIRYYTNVHFKIQGEAPPGKSLHYNTALHLVRIVQEAVSNALKHAEAKNILIITTSENNQWKLVVKDDGKGFDYIKARDLQEGNGLHNMQQRAIEANLIFTVEAVKGGGTSVTILC